MSNREAIRERNPSDVAADHAYQAVEHGPVADPHVVDHPRVVGILQALKDRDF